MALSTNIILHFTISYNRLPWSTVFLVLIHSHLWMQLIYLAHSKHCFLNDVQNKLRLGHFFCHGSISKFSFTDSEYIMVSIWNISRWTTLLKYDSKTGKENSSQLYLTQNHELNITYLFRSIFKSVVNILWKQNFQFFRVNEIFFLDFLVDLFDK